MQTSLRRKLWLIGFAYTSQPFLNILKPQGSSAIPLNLIWERLCHGPEALVSLTQQCPCVQHMHTQGFGQHSNRKLYFRSLSVKASGKTSLNGEQNMELALRNSKRIHEAREIHVPRLQSWLPVPRILDVQSCDLHCCYCTLRARAKVSLCERLPRNSI